MSVGLIVTFFSTSSGLLGFDRNLSIPGKLTSAHANLTDGKQCGLCHADHGLDGIELVASLVEYQDISQQCIKCHAFAGNASNPHNMAPKSNGNGDRIGCIGCHTEHKGTKATITAIADRDCHECHKEDVVFDSFDGQAGEPHPPFRTSFGRLAETTINFDHAKHFDTHFGKPAVQDYRPKGCQSCHEVDNAGIEVKTPSFEESCAACHKAQIKDQPMLLLAWPEMESMEAPSIDIKSLCDITTTWDDVDFEAVSFELPGAIDTFLLDIDPDDMSSFEVAYQDLAQQMALVGVYPLADLVANAGGDPASLLAGLSPETASRPACDWLANEEYEAFGSLDGQGWFAEPLGISYRPKGHADPVLKAWLEFGHQLDLKETGRDGIDDLSAELFDTDTGPGSCISCHRTSEESVLRWKAAVPEKAHTSFVHQPHIALDKAKNREACTSCHKMSDGPSNEARFDRIDIATCQECHGKNGGNDSCSTCHSYHPLR